VVVALSNGQKKLKGFGGEITAPIVAETGCREQKVRVHRFSKVQLTALEWAGRRDLHPHLRPRTLGLIRPYDTRKGRRLS
jgi:hypothetical protein